jgi:hypothetical protein
MFKRLIASLTLDYDFIARGRGMLSQGEIDMIVRGDRIKVHHAGSILPLSGETPTEDDRADLAECGLIADHIQQMAEWIDQLARNEIV